MAQSKLKTGWKKIPLIGRVAIVGVGSIGALMVINKLLGSNIKKAPVDYGQIPQVFETNGTGVLWNPDPLAKELATNLEGYNAYTYPETVAKILSLNADQTKLLYNHYNTYYTQDYPTLTQLIAGEWGDWSGTYAKGVNHLKSFGLNERNPYGARKKSRRLQHEKKLKNLGYKF